jgi:YggT family protein
MNINPFIDLIAMVLNLYAFILIIHIIFVWLIYFDILNRYNQVIHRINDLLYRLTEPVLSKVRQFIPAIGGIDISPIVVFILIRFFISLLYNYFYVYHL